MRNPARFLPVEKSLETMPSNLFSRISSDLGQDRPNRCLRHDPDLERHLDLDIEAGIRTLVLYVGDVIAELAACFPGSLEFGLWDREMCTVAMYRGGEAGNGPGECRFSARRI